MYHRPRIAVLGTSDARQAKLEFRSHQERPVITTSPKLKKGKYQSVPSIVKKEYMRQICIAEQQKAQIHASSPSQEVGLEVHESISREYEKAIRLAYIP